MAWDTIVALGALAVSVTALLSRLFGNSLSRGEHDEFKSAVNKQLCDFRERIFRLEDRH